MGRCAVMQKRESISPPLGNCEVALPSRHGSHVLPHGFSVVSACTLSLSDEGDSNSASAGRICFFLCATAPSKWRLRWMTRLFMPMRCVFKHLVSAMSLPLSLQVQSLDT
ncbi:uncharacterized protein PV07_07141 [Cladophialophora immunda]|uniref:Uncharacterized protein n=1 Tax=Cladophialophora immunda TaxID=569365 RepID=A0A0D2C8I2_9EURO|nr:uncharacterized protein PV07_07141 [Cladophialophora immunda]KIW27403.1 hypothetical protein PV07_07141 [Cladophialophora immunda]